MKTVVVTEGEFDRDLLKMLLEDFGSHALRVVSGEGRSSAESLARTYLIDNPAVALVLDADTVAPDRVQEQNLIISEYMRQLASSGRFAVLLAEPELETIFFEAPALALRLFGRPLSQEQWTKARYAPKEVLRQLLKKRPDSPVLIEDLAKILTPDGIQLLRHTRLIGQLREFVGRSIAAAA